MRSDADDHRQGARPHDSENAWQGGYVVDTLTDLIEEAVTKKFDAIGERGGAMDTMHRRGNIQDESMVYNVMDQSCKKYDDSLPLIGVKTFLPKDHGGEIATEIELIRSVFPHVRVHEDGTRK